MVIHERVGGLDPDVEDDARGHDGNDVDLAAIARVIGKDWDDLRRSLRRWATVEIQRLRLNVTDSFYAVLFDLGALLSVLAAIVTAGVYFMIGLRGLFARWTTGGVPELLAAAVGLSLALGGALALRTWRRYTIVRTAARRLAVLGSTNNAAPSSHPRQRKTGEPV